MKLEPGSPEYLIALRAIADEYDIPARNDFRVHDLFIAGPGRLFLRDWAARDTIDPDSFEGKMTNGRRWGETDPVRILQARWHDRARLTTFEIGLRDMQNIRDWLLESAREQLDWLRNVDELGRPRKLLKCGTTAQLIHEARKFEALRGQVRQRPPAVVAPADGFDPVTVADVAPLGPDDERFQVSAGAGYTVVRLLSPAALDLESDRMRHCVGRGAYDDRVVRPHAWRYYSLRDPDGQP